MLAMPLWIVAFTAHAETYLEFSSGLIVVDTPGKSAHPLLADLRLGYARDKHQFELALMTSARKDEVSRLEVKTPSVVSVFWHFIPQQQSSLKFHTILGASRVEVDADYDGMASSDEFYSGISYGIGWEERFESYPQLKLSVDLIQLYHGEDLNINTVSLGFHFEF
jgi:hypothetical protein